MIYQPNVFHSEWLPLLESRKIWSSDRRSILKLTDKMFAMRKYKNVISPAFSIEQLTNLIYSLKIIMVSACKQQQFF